jgi:hypothetical protein
MYKNKLIIRNSTNTNFLQNPQEPPPNIDFRGGGQQPTLIPHITSTQNIIPLPPQHTPLLQTITPDNPILAMWQHTFLTLPPVEFTHFTHNQTRQETPTCHDPSGHGELLHIQIAHFTYGEYQSSLDLHTILAGIYKTLNIHILPPILNQPDLDSILDRGTPPTNWTSRRYFGPTHTHLGPLHTPSLCGIWYNGHHHFVVFYMCPDYWTILDPLIDNYIPDHNTINNVASALTTTYQHHIVQCPPLPRYRRVNRIAIQNDSPLTSWPCVTIALLTTLHLTLGNTFQTALLPTASLANKCSHYTKPFYAGLSWARPLTFGNYNVSIPISSK